MKLEDYCATKTVFVCSNCKKEVPDSDTCVYCGKPLVLMAKCNGGPKHE